ncbi:UPF0014-domain-containing protein [Fomitiporia mediterranea MF3/22]|uniref:UPF0014-domain-containing protein n=1 Tax=Fomitiporia mediterranea (strain MF3/22) TaxID=694068 RepID=UPI000440812D|nr:UPF0014-domain-containing protein [Fomitiporia mediterranea MF3/22]EJD07030.1 UPF0014-domain-containing protein [Fomitiporia mediterranea MF3/22]
MDDPAGSKTHLTWANVGLGFAFVAFDAIISRLFGLGVGVPLITAAVRCVIQLAIMALVLQKIFEADNPWGVAGIALLLNLLGTIEVVVNKAKMRFDNMFLIVLFSMVCSTIPVSILGASFAMSIEPFWKPDQYIPIVGMLCGATIAGVVITLNFVLKEIYENRDKVETYLAFGASRLEACQPVAKEALRLALTPPINQMSVLGIIAIPGMMTGALLGGAPVQQAARLQMVIMFMIAAASALAAILVTVVALGTVVDDEQRVRAGRVDVRKHWVWRMRERGWEWGVGKVKGIGEGMRVRVGLRKGGGNGERVEDGAGEERNGLLG